LEPAQPPAAPQAEQSPTPAEHRRWQVGELICDRYQVTQASSDQNERYQVLDRDLGLTYTVKTPGPAVLTKPDRLARLHRVAMAWIGLGSHANICTAHYLHTIDGRPRLFLDPVDGVSLNQWLRENQQARGHQLLDLAIRMAAGFEHAHTSTWLDEQGAQQTGAVHGCVGLECVLITSDGNALITDFGLARAMPPFIAPEQWLSATTSGMADIYAFGCLLYLLLCRRLPFALDRQDANGPSQQQRQAWQRLHCEQAPADPQQLNPQLDAELATLMRQCLEKQPTTRAASFSYLLAALRGIYQRLTGSAAYQPRPAVSPLPADLLNNRGVALAGQSQLSLAEVQWQQALKLDPAHSEASFNLALYQWAHRGVADGDVVTWLQEAQQGQAAAWRYQHLTGRLCQTLGDHQQAQQLLAAAAAAQQLPNLARDHAFACCAVAADTGDANLWRTAAEILSQAGSSLQNDPAVLVASAVAFFNLGDVQTAQRLYAGARAIRADLPEGLQPGAAMLVPGLHLVMNHHTRLLGRALSVAVSADGQQALVQSERERFLLIDLKSGEITKKLRATVDVRSLAMTPDGLTALTVGGSEAVSIWNLESGGSRDKLQLHSGFINDLAISPNSRWMAAAGSDGSVIVWDLESHRRVATMKTHSGFVSCTAISGDGRIVASGGGDGTVDCSNLEQGTRISCLIGHTDEVTAVAMSADASLILSGSKDQTARLWSPMKEEPLLVLKGHTDTISFVALSPDQQRALTGSADKTLRLWDLQRGRTCMVTRFEAGVCSGAVAADWSTVVVAHGTTVTQLRLDVSPEQRYTWAVASATVAGTAYAQVQAQALPQAELALAGEADPFEPILAEPLIAEPIPLEPLPEPLPATPQAPPQSHQAPPSAQAPRQPPVAGPTAVQRPSVAKAPSSVAPAPVLPGVKKVQRMQPRDIWLSLRKWVIIAAVLALIPLGFWINKIRVQRSLNFNQKEIQQTSNRLNGGVLPLDRMTDRYYCQLDRWDDYLVTFTGESHRYNHLEAKVCLVKLGNTVNIEQLLATLRTHTYDLVRGVNRGASFQDIGSVLTHLDDATIPTQMTALHDPEPVLRNIVVLSLAARRSDVAIQALLAQAHDPDPNVRKALSAHFAEIVSSELLTREEALSLATTWAGDSEPEVRVNVANGLRVLSGSRTKRLLHELEQDTDESVRSAAERTLRLYLT
jgi:tetratricopeptide (TPR) repeat protein